MSAQDRPEVVIPLSGNADLRRTLAAIAAEAATIAAEAAGPELRVTRSRRASIAWLASVEWSTPFVPLAGPRLFGRQGVGGMRVYALTRRAARRRAGIAALREKRIPTAVAVALLSPPV